MAADLATIRLKIRRLTRTPSITQLSDNEIDDYVNTFILYDFPGHLRLFNFRETFTFFTNPHQDVYSTLDVPFPLTDPLFNFRNKYISIHPPIYIAGYESYFTQSRDQFFGNYPMLNFINTIGTTGDNINTAFAGTLTNFPVLRNNVLFSSIDANGNGLALVDVPFNATSGNLVIPNQAPPLILDPNNSINYVTGVYNINFPAAPAAGAVINSQTVPYQASRPQAMLYYDDQFTLRPVPDQPYRVNMEVFVRPTSLFNNAAAVPELEGFWQYIAYGAAKKVFEDRMDLESVQMIFPEFKKQETLVLRRTLVQYTNERTATIYTDQSGFNNGGGWGSGGGLF